MSGASAGRSHAAAARLGAFVAALYAAAPAAVQLTIRLARVPAGTPPNAVLHVAGSFNAWTPGAPDAVLAAQRQRRLRGSELARVAALVAERGCRLTRRCGGRGTCPVP